MTCAWMIELAEADRARVATWRDAADGGDRGVSPTLRMKPIFRPESWHLSEITKVGCQEQRVIHNRGGRDFQVLGSDTYALFSQPLKFVRRCDIERDQLPIREKI